LNLSGSDCEKKVASQTKEYSRKKGESPTTVFGENQGCWSLRPGNRSYRTNTKSPSKGITNRLTRTRKLAPKQTWVQKQRTGDVYPGEEKNSEPQPKWGARKEAQVVSATQKKKPELKGHQPQRGSAWLGEFRSGKDDQKKGNCLRLEEKQPLVWLRPSTIKMVDQ